MSKIRLPRLSSVLGCVGVVWAMLGLAYTQPARAHEQAVAFTEVRFIPNADSDDCLSDGCRIEVVHRLVIHDAEHALEKSDRVRSDLVGDTATQARFNAYVSDRFLLFDTVTGQTLDMELLGGEVERGYYWVYQEGFLPAGSSALMLSQTVLLDVISTQTNRVNVVYKDTLKTLIFSQGVAPQAYMFEQ